MKEKYEPIKILIENLAQEDIITVSGTGPVINDERENVFVDFFDDLMDF